MAETNRERMQRRKATEPWLRWQQTARWREVRDRVFQRDSFTCQCGCGVVEHNTALLVCRHREPHEGVERLFWDEANMQTMLKACSAKRPVSKRLHQRGIWD